MTEVWKPIKDYKDYYISNLGRVKSTKFNKERIFDSLKGKYYFVNLYNGSTNTRRTITVHRLVAEAFLEYSSSNDVIDHIDGDTHNNCVTNLQVISQRLNTTKGKMQRKSKYPGVSWRENRQSWRIRILYNNRRIVLGSFKDEKEAAEVYKQFSNDMENETFNLESYISKRNNRNLTLKTNNYAQCNVRS